MSFLNTLPGLINGFVNETLSNNHNNSQQIRTQQENECNNLLVISKLILNAFLDISVRGSRNINIDTKELVDLLVILEKCLWHGFKISSTFRKPSLILKKVDDELWIALGQISKTNFSFNDAYKCVDALDNLKTSTTKIRALLRLGIMKKELADYFQVICTSNLSNFYENWAFLRGEQGSSLAGSLLALRVFDCNLLLDYEVLMELPHNIDLTSYVKIPVLPSQFTHYTEEEAEVEREKTFQEVLDQKHYIEEQNRQLTKRINYSATLTNVRRKLSENRSIDGSTGITQKIDELNEKLEEERNQRLDAVERYALKRDEWKKALDEKEVMRIQCGEVIKKIKTNIVERNRHFLSCMKNVDATVDLTFIDYEKRTKSLESKLQTIHEEFLKKSTHPKKEFYDLMIKMEDKQGALAEVIKENESLYEKVAALEKQSAAAKNAIQELAELRLIHAQQSQKLQETEQALIDLGPHLSDSKLQVVTMKEQLLPSTEWVKDSDVTQCLACDTDFSVTVRKHHCRRCGQIFCDSCSNHRVNLPSHAKQVRVCSRCLRFLDSVNKESTVSLS